MVNITFTDSVTNMADMATGISTEMGNLFPAVLLFAIFFSIYGLSIKNGASAAFISSSFVTSIAGVLMMIAGFANWVVVVVPVILFFMSLAFRFFDRG